MSFLNALASNGLSVGLRFYNARMNNAAQAESARRPAALESPAEKSCPASSSNPEAAKSRPAPPSQTLEEMAVGRAEARARLSSEGTLGQLLAAAGEENRETGVSQTLDSQQKRELAELQARESRIKAEVEASVQKGVPGAEAVEYEYTVGPDGQRYISGLKDDQASADKAAEAQGAAQDPKELSEEEKQQVEDLKRRDQEVRTHEQAHVAAAAGLAGAPVYEYQTGPDGKRYAIGGHVDLRTSGSSDPETALREAEIIKRAATAPAEPSSTDRSVAAEAGADINRLRAEKAAQRSAEGEEEEQTGSSTQPQTVEAHSLKAEATPIHNGDGFGRQALGAYAAAKFGPASFNIRPVLARA